MKKLAVMLLLLFGAGKAAGQIAVELVLAQEQYLPHEELVARVRIANNSGQTLRLGEQPDWIQFVIENSEGAYVKEVSTPDVLGGFELESSHTATKRVNLASAYDLSRTGRYKIVVSVKIPAFGATYASQPKNFTISNGAKIWNQTFGVPPRFAEARADGRPEIRQYQLVQANLKDELRLYARVMDERENTLRVLPIGALVSFSRPEPQLDRWSNLHVLYQDGARSFSYSVINPEGQLIARESHLNTETRPILAVNEEGRIYVKGGVRRVTRDDLPPPTDEELSPEPDLAAAEETGINTATNTTKITNNAAAKVKPAARKKSSSADAKEKPKR